MTTQINLKEIERKAFRSTFQDGLTDIQHGLVVISMAIFIYRPADGYRPLNIILAVLLISLAGGLFMAGKKYITLPRMGQVRFGAVRKQKRSTLAIILGVIVLLQIGLLGLTTQGWLNPQAAASINDFLTSHDLMLVAVALIGALIVGTSMTFIAYFSDFPRGYYIAMMMSLAVFVMIYFNRPLYPILIGVLVLLPGLVLLVRFLKAYPLPKEASNG